MRIAMQSDKFGAIELHARVSGDAVGAAIVVEKRDAHAALALELPGLQQALSDKQLRVEQVTLTHSMLSSTAGDAGASSQQGQKGATPRSALPSFQTTAESLAAGSFLAQEQLGVFNSQGRLSVLA
jgi:flagellar hook-length control protein FliK